jgi:hypothetical protein
MGRVEVVAGSPKVNVEMEVASQRLKMWLKTASDGGGSGEPIHLSM